MTQRVLLILLGGVIYFVLREYFGLPRSVSAIIGMVPFGLAESKGLIGPYEKSARDVMFEDSADKDGSPPKA
jgi:hypothetical protein